MQYKFDFPDDYRISTLQESSVESQGIFEKYGHYILLGSGILLVAILIRQTKKSINLKIRPNNKVSI
jgi:hypothetical protein